jgi:hypothetical protein
MKKLKNGKRTFSAGYFDWPNMLLRIDFYDVMANTLG